MLPTAGGEVRVVHHGQTDGTATVLRRSQLESHVKPSLGRRRHGASHRTRYFVTLDEKRVYNRREVASFAGALPNWTDKKWLDCSFL